jgi:hypothetical protein
MNKYLNKSNLSSLSKRNILWKKRAEKIISKCRYKKAEKITSKCGYNLFCESWWEEGPRLTAPVHTGPGAHSASYTMGTGSSPGVKRPGSGDDHPFHLAPTLKKK